MPPTLRYIQYKPFDRALRELRKRGGPSRLAAEQVFEAVILWKNGHDVPLRNTRKGESRLKHVAKYDLHGYHRLVVWENDGFRMPLTVGNHGEVDRWLDERRGWEFVVNRDTKEVDFSPGSERHSPVRPDDVSLFGRGPILARIPEELLSRMNLPPATLAALQTSVSFENVDQDQTRALLEAFVYPSEEIKTAVVNAVSLIATGQDQCALACLHKAIGVAVAAHQDPDAFRAAIESGASSDRMALLDQLGEEETRRLLSLDRFADWMLFLHPDQEALVREECPGPRRLLGVSGSGKTCVLVHRAFHLALKYPRQRILIITLSRALVHLIEYLLDCLCTQAARRCIEVLSTYDYCYKLVKLIDPPRLIEQSDPRSGEDLEACWRDFLEKPHARRHCDEISHVLECRKDSVSPSSYLLDEMIWVRSGFGYESRSDYLACPRTTRGIGFPTYDAANPPAAGAIVAGMPADTRLRILRLLADYEEYMAAGGLLDPDGVSLAAYELRHRVRGFHQLQARCVLVDEVQDFSTVELAVIKEIPTAEVDGVFLCGDQAQKVFPKQQNMTLAGFDLQGRGKLLRRNYRNTRQILQAAFRIIQRYAQDAAIDASEIQEPEYAFRDGYRPDLYACESRQQQVDLVMTYLKHYRAEELDTICVCSTSDVTLRAFEQQARAAGFRTLWLTGLSDYRQHGVRVSSLECVKGHEFAHVFVLDVSETELPRRGLPSEEYWRDAFQLYVAMTRARDTLVMTFVHNRSILLRDLRETVLEADAHDLLSC